jgi:cell division septal protein FtsQ
MDEELKRKNRRLLIALLCFAILLCLLVILWKLSIYKAFP